MHYCLTCKKRIPIIEANLFADYLHQHSLPPSAIKLTIKNLLPCAKIKLAVSKGNDNFSAHHLSLQVRICVIFSGIVVPILVDILSSTNKGTVK